MIDKTLTKEDIEKRIDDWVLRISDLYSSIREWLESAPSYVIKERSDVTMYEELMQKYNIPQKTLTSLDIYCDKHIVVTIRPIGLWIIGANGRVDILFKDGAVTLVDESERFQTPSWVAHKRPRIDKGIKFDKNFLFDLLGVHENEHI